MNENALIGNNLSDNILLLPSELDKIQKKSIITHNSFLKKKRYKTQYQRYKIIFIIGNK